MAKKKTAKSVPPSALEREEPPFPIDVAGLHETERELPALDGLDVAHHRFDAPDLHAINAALAAERSLLLRGEPGTGKSQLARAAAFLLRRRFAWKVVDAHTEVSDLFYTFDAVARLAYAQIVGAVTHTGAPKERERVLEELAVGHFLRPGPLWWAFDEKTARAQEATFLQRCGGKIRPGAAPAADDKRRGWVVLIDEIDKADPSVPNGLLEALGQGTFEVPGGGKISLHKAAVKPLVVITTNEERELPSAFVRRCMVRRIEVPDDLKDPANKKLYDWLVLRGKTHFKGASQGVLNKTASMVIADRRAAQRLGVTAPGQAEYLDLVRAVMKLGKNEATRLSILDEIGAFALTKHVDPASASGGC